MAKAGTVAYQALQNCCLTLSSCSVRIATLVRDEPVEYLLPDAFIWRRQKAGVLSLLDGGEPCLNAF